MIRSLLALAALSLAGCGPEAPGVAPGRLEQASGSAPASKTLAIQWQGQQTGYWCGPGSTRIALSSRISPPSQTTLAGFLGTTTNGTDTIQYISNALNHYEGVGFWARRAITDPPPQGQIDTLQNELVGTISNGYAMVGNIISGWRPPGYPGGTIYHYIAIVGYDQDGARAMIADPAGQCAAGTSWCNVPSTYWVTTHDLAVWISGSTGYTTSGLAPTGGTPSTGTLIGAIYQGGATTNRVAGAVVTVGGQSVTTGADGIYSFDLAPGTYSASVTKAGYGSNSVARAVTGGAQIWGSMEINPVAPPNGTLSGRVTAAGTAVGAATVTVNGASAMTGADGTYRFDLAPGAYSVTVQKEGYADASLMRTVTSGQTVSGDVTLQPLAVPDTTPPDLTVTAPSSARSELAVSAFAGTVTEAGAVQVTQNGGPAQTVPVTSGAWTVDVTLQPGANVLAVSAVDAAGNRATQSRTVSFASGLSGVVQVDGVESGFVSAALVTLTDRATGAVQTATTDAAGAFSFDAQPGEVLVKVEASGYLTWRQAETVSADQRGSVKIALTPGVDEGGQQRATGTGPQQYRGSACSVAGGPALLLLAAMVLSRRRRR